MTQSELLEIEIAEGKKHQVMRDKCVKLLDSKLYKDVIGEGYFKDEAARLCMAKSNPDLNDAQKKNIDNMIAGIGGVHTYLMTLLQRGRQVDQDMESIEETREEIANEENQ